MLPDMRLGRTALLSDLPGALFVYENDKIFVINEKVKREFTQLEAYLGSNGWSILTFVNEDAQVSLTELKTQWNTLIVPDSNFANADDSGKFAAFAKALGY